jgi:mannitol-1-phosphate 5-dehydrogenase
MQGETVDDFFVHELKLFADNAFDGIVNIDIYNFDDGIVIARQILRLGLSEKFLKIGLCFGFPNCAVDRIVPNVNLPKERGIDVFVEAFYEWSVERHAVKVNDQISGVHYVDLLDPFLERKLFMLNGAHATIAYLGYLKQYTFIHEAIRDASILEVISKFHRQSAEALSLKYKVDLDTLLAYSEKIIKRFRNVHLGDLVVRVGADPVRKLSYDDRLISPLRLCVDFGAEYSAIVSGIAAGYHFDHMDDVKAQKIQASIREEGIQKSVALYSGLLERSVLNRAICEAYEKMK